MPISGLHPEAFEFVIQQFDVLQPLYPGIAGPSRNNRPHGETVLHGQCFAVHCISEHGIGMQSFLDGNGALEIRHLSERDIGSVK